jgi:hypothetical protein
MAAAGWRGMGRHIVVTAVVIAFIAAAIAIGLAVAGLLQIDKLRRRVEYLTTKLEQDVTAGAERAGSVANSKIEDALTQLKISRAEYDQAIGKQRRRTDLLYLSADAGVSKADQMVTDLEHYAVRTLEHQVTSAPAHPIERGALYSKEPAVLDVVPDLIDSFLASLGADRMYRQDDGEDGWKSYLRWPADSDESAALLRPLLAQARAGGGADGTTDGAPVAGVPELRALLSVLVHGGRAAIALGRLVVANTPTGTWAGFAPDGWPGFTEDQKRTAVTGVGSSLMTAIDAADVVEITD